MMTAMDRNDGGGDERHQWELHEVEFVAEGVRRIPLPLPNDGLRAVNVYAIEDGDALTLIDGGWAYAESLQRLEVALESFGARLSDVRRILVTHVHRDHYTQAVAIRRRSGATVLLGAEEAGTLRIISSLDAEMPTTQLNRLRRHGAVALADHIAARRPMVVTDRSYFESPDGWITAGSEIAVGQHVLTAIATPGHTRGHLVFRSAPSGDSAGLLFAGDHVLPHITPSIGFEADRPPVPLRDYLSSLERVLALPDTPLLPAHGPTTASVHSRVAELLAHHADRLNGAEEVIVAGAATAHDVADRLTWTRRGTAFRDLDPFNAMLAVLETAAHLDVLVLRGRAQRDGDPESGEGVVRYGPVGGQ